jgi:hypothetical protein
LKPLRRDIPLSGRHYFPERGLLDLPKVFPSWQVRQKARRFTQVESDCKPGIPVEGIGASRTTMPEAILQGVGHLTSPNVGL